MSDHHFGFEVLSLFFFFLFFVFSISTLSFMTLIPHTSHLSFVGLSVVCCVFGQRVLKFVFSEKCEPVCGNKQLSVIS